VGLTVIEIFESIYKGKVKGLYIMGENPLISDPDINHLRRALEKVDFLVIQDIFLTDTAKYADIVLPAATSFEKEGTFTNTERRIQKISKCIEPPGEAKPDWEIVTELAKKFGYKWNYKKVWDITDEIAKVIPIYGGITSKRVLGGERIQWPCIDEKDPGTETLHIGKFKIGKGKLKYIDYREPFELPDENYPFILTTGRILSEYHTRTMTGKVEGIKEITGTPFCFINKEDAKTLKVQNGSKVKVYSKRGQVILSVKLSEKIKKGVVFIPFHFEANLLTHNILDSVSKIPEYKVSACNIGKL